MSTTTATTASAVDNSSMSPCSKFSSFNNRKNIWSYWTYWVLMKNARQRCTHPFHHLHHRHSHHHHRNLLHYHHLLHNLLRILCRWQRPWGRQRGKWLQTEKGVRKCLIFKNNSPEISLLGLRLFVCLFDFLSDDLWFVCLPLYILKLKMATLWQSVVQIGRIGSLSDSDNRSAH